MNRRFTVHCAATLAMLAGCGALAAAEGPARDLRQPLPINSTGQIKASSPITVSGQKSAPVTSTPGIAGRQDVKSLLKSATPVDHRGTRYLVSEGKWYEQRGDDVVASRPPAGMLVKDLPEGYIVRWVAGVPYFHADGVYYVWRERQRRYEVLQAPPQGEPAPAAE